MADVDWMLHHGLIKAFDHENALRIVLNDYKALPDGTASESATAFCKRILSPLLQDLPAYKEVWHLTTEQKREIAELVKSVSLKNLRANVKDWQDEDPIPCMVEPYRMRDEIIFSRKTMQAGQAPSEPKLHDFLSLLQPHIDMIELDEQCAVAEQAIPSVDTLLEIKLQSSRADLESIRKHYMEAQALKSSARSEVIFDPSDLETEEVMHSRSRQLELTTTSDDLTALPHAASLPSRIIRRAARTATPCKVPSRNATTNHSASTAAHRSLTNSGSERLGGRSTTSYPATKS